MKKNLTGILLLMFFLSSCELEYTQYEVSIFNQSSYPLLIEYETKETQKTIRLEKENDVAFLYIESFDGVLPEFTKESFNETILDVNISIELENGELLPLSKQLENLEYWKYEKRYDDQHIIHMHGLSLTDEDLE